MKAVVLLPMLFFYSFGYTQEIPKETDAKTPRHSYAKIDFSIPIRINQYAGEIDPYTGQKEPFFFSRRS